MEVQGKDSTWFGLLTKDAFVSSLRPNEAPLGRSILLIHDQEGRPRRLPPHTFSRKISEEFQPKSLGFVRDAREKNHSPFKILS